MNFIQEYHPEFGVDFYKNGTNHLVSIACKISWDDSTYEPPVIGNRDALFAKEYQFLRMGTAWYGDDHEFPTFKDAQKWAKKHIIYLRKRNTLALSGQFKCKAKSKEKAMLAFIKALDPKNTVFYVGATINFQMGHGEGYKTFKSADFEYDGEVLTFSPIFFW